LLTNLFHQLLIMSPPENLHQPATMRFARLGRTPLASVLKAPGETHGALAPIHPRLHRSISWLTAISLFCALVPAMFASNARSDVSSLNYTRRVWQVQNGLPEDVVQAFAQTPDRFLWIGTTAGLVRFDGVSFTVYDHRNTRELGESNIFCLLATRDGSLWIGTDGGGLVLYRNGIFRLFSSTEGLTDGFIRTIFQDHAGTIWIGTDGGLFRYAGSRIERVDGNSRIQSIAVHSISEDSRFGLWVGGSRLLCVRRGKPTEYRLPDEPRDVMVKSILIGSDGTIWVGTVSGLYQGTESRNASSTTFKRVKGISNTVRTLSEGPEGAIWMGTIGGGIVIRHHDKLISLKSPSWLPSNTVLKLFRDGESNIWVGTQHGMLRLKKTSVGAISLPGNADSDFGTIYQDKNRDFWVASSVLFRIRDGVARRYTFPQLGGDRVRNVFRDSFSNLWLGTDGSGVFRLNGTHCEHLTTKNGLSNNYIRAFLQSRDGSVWIATDAGINHWVNGSLTSYRDRDGLAYRSVRSLLEDSHGTLWIGTDHGLSHMREGRFLNDEPVQELSTEKVWSIHEDVNGAMWFATRADGLYRWKLGELAHFTTSNGLVSNHIYQLVEDRTSQFWMSGPEGVSVVRRSELEDTARHPAHRLAVKLFGHSQGIEMTQLYGGTQPSGILADDGVWFPSSQGPVHISPVSGPASDPPPIVIDKVLADGQEHDQDRSGEITMVLRPGNRKIQFNYVAVSLGSPEDIRFRYKLEGFDRTWIDSDGTHQVYYTNLLPGAYRFRVLAFNMEDPLKTTEASLGVRQEPHFYRTLWFWPCCVLIMGGFMWISHLIRLHELRQRFAAVLDERSRVAREMHDTIIQGCVGVSTLLEGICSQAEAAGEERSTLLNYARMQLRETLDEARRALWHLRKDIVSATEVGPLLLSLAEEVAKETSARVVCHTKGNQFPIATAQARELLMVTREALYNAVHHSNASVITFGIAFSRDNLGIQISDNGSGFEGGSDVAAKPGHYGLMGMRERVEQMKGEFVLKSRLGNGTQLSFRIPCKPIFPAAPAAEVTK
jgi:ligand-binding sensor domain-containing protein/signal transduction histidine kinase